MSYFRERFMEKLQNMVTTIHFEYYTYNPYHFAFKQTYLTIVSILITFKMCCIIKTAILFIRVHQQQNIFNLSYKQ